MFLSRQLGIAFFRNPRTGSRAIRQLILPYCDIREVRHTRVTEETPFYKHIPPREARPHVERMGIERAPLATFAPTARGTFAFRDLWAEIAARLWR